ncbi:Vitamin B12 import ATP-binding protein BtuD [bioreactor metagenome]|uniref:Vitamin B12 import ATP-binding protein BtuD n=1 Tax=bioreactor metagenome TaxID=1076179 RepID=A0A644X5R7_9ZZZZ
MIEVKHLTKKYGNNTAVSDLSFTIQSGQIYGLLGPNGAGKSTTMNIMTGCLAATSGDVTINGHDIFEDAAKAKKLIGYLPEEPPLYQDMTPREYLSFVAKAKGVARDKRDEQMRRAMSVTQIDAVSDRLIKNLSKGYRQRVGIAQALLGDPEIIILDEPTVGLDPRQIIEIRDLIKNLGKNHTVILSSHILSEVSAICDSIIIISKGKIVASDTTEHLERLLAGSSTLELVVRATEDEVRSALSSIEGISQIVCKASPGEGTAEVTISSENNADLREKVFFAFCEKKRPILGMKIARASLEDVFIELTSDKANEAQQSEGDVQTPSPDETDGENEAVPPEDTQQDREASEK